MKERPIIMQAESVRAILEGRKTQTRRVVKPQPVYEGKKSYGDAWAWRKGKDWFSGVTTEQLTGKYGLCHEYRSIYGQPGDRLWVKETWRKICLDEPTNLAEKKTEDGDIRYKATSPHGLFGEVWRPSMFMPRWASRLTLEVVKNRVERLRDISNCDIFAEGLPKESTPKDKGMRWQFQQRWDAINGKRGFPWESNPWVWVIEFKRLAPAAAASEVRA